MESPKRPSEHYKVEPSEMTEYPAQHIVMLRPDIRNTDGDIYFIQIAKALQNFGHRVTIITCTPNPGELHKDLRNIYVMETSTWMPQNIYGKLRYLLYLLRTLAVALKYVISHIEPQPSVVFSNGSCLALPILSLVKLSTIIQMQDPLELSSTNWLLRKSLIYSDEVIVADNKSKELWQTEGKKNCSTLYPCVDLPLSRATNHLDVKEIVPNFPRNGFLFCCFGDYFVQSNFELALAGFCLALNMVDAKHSQKMHLVLGGNYNPIDQHQKEYLSKIKRLVYIQMYSKHVTLLETVSATEKKCLMFEARGILDPTLEAKFNGTILEAMCLAKTVIGTNCSFGREVLVHQITGYLVAPNPQDFAEVIEKLINNKILPVYIGNLAETEFRYKYSFLQFARYVNCIVSKHTLKYTHLF